MRVGEGRRWRHRWEGKASCWLEGAPAACDSQNGSGWTSWDLQRCTVDAAYTVHACVHVRVYIVRFPLALLPKCTLAISVNGQQYVYMHSFSTLCCVHDRLLMYRPALYACMYTYSCKSP